MSALNIAEEIGIAAPDRAAATTTHATHPFLWSVRREIWESPSIVGAPVAIASLLILSVLYTVIRYSGQFLLQTELDNAGLSSAAVMPLLPVPLLLGVTMLLVSAFYSLDGLLSERQDRSILFWKSLPVSDTTTVLSKMAVPMVVLPVVTFVIAIVTQTAILVIEVIALLAHHASVSAAWAGIPMLSLLGLMTYTLVAVTLWYAPIYAWFLLVSAWARRLALIWAVMPFVLLAFFERVVYHTHYVRDFINNRISGVFPAAFANGPRRYGPHELQHFHFDWTPAHFLASPALWGGLLFAALALILIIRLRRSSGPI